MHLFLFLLLIFAPSLLAMKPAEAADHQVDDKGLDLSDDSDFFDRAMARDEAHIAGLLAKITGEKKRFARNPELVRGTSRDKRCVLKNVGNGKKRFVEEERLFVMHEHGATPFFGEQALAMYKILENFEMDRGACAWLLNAFKEMGDGFYDYLEQVD